MRYRDAPLGFQDDLAALRARLQAGGFHRRPGAAFMRAWFVHFAIAMGGLAAIVAWPSTPVRALALLVSCFGFIGVATLGHTASHRAAGEGRLFNRIFLYVTYPLMLQLSARFWHYTHVQTHHTAPNVHGLDNDCDLRPAFAINEAQQQGGSPARRRYWRLQGFLFPLVLPLNAFNVQRKGWQFLVREVRDPAARCAATWIDLACMTMHYAIWLAIPMLFLSPGLVIALYLLRTAIVGTGLFAILAPGHFPAEAIVMARDQRDAGDFYLRQAVATVNFRTGWLGHFLCSGLEYQLEHHFFPAISHLHHRRMAPLIREFCERHGLPYRTLGWGEAVWKSYLVFFHTKPVVADVVALRRQGHDSVTRSDTLAA